MKHKTKFDMTINEANIFLNNLISYFLTLSFSLQGMRHVHQDLPTPHHTPFAGPDLFIKIANGKFRIVYYQYKCKHFIF